MDLNHGPLGYEPSELPSCSTPRRLLLATLSTIGANLNLSTFGRVSYRICAHAHSHLTLSNTIEKLCTYEEYNQHLDIFFRFVPRALRDTK